MKIIAIHVIGYDTPRYVSHYEVLNGEAIILLSSKREDAQTFNAEPALEAQRIIRDSITKYIAGDGAHMLRILKETNGVMIEPQYPPRPAIYKLTKIKRLDNPNDQTVAFAQRIDDWMKQWTLENNYKMMMVESPNIALHVWWADFERTVNSMFHSAVKNLNLKEQFAFEYQTCEIKEDGSFWPSGSSRVAFISEVIKDKEDAKESA